MEALAYLVIGKGVSPESPITQPLAFKAALAVNPSPDGAALAPRISRILVLVPEVALRSTRKLFISVSVNAVVKSMISHPAQFGSVPWVYVMLDDPNAIRVIPVNPARDRISPLTEVSCSLKEVRVDRLEKAEMFPLTPVV